MFQKIFDDVKYLCRVAVAGSKEARQLEKIRKVMAEVYRGAKGTVSGEKFSLDKNKNFKHTKKSRYSETETLFLRWENSSAPAGELKKFSRFGKTRYYQKTETAVSSCPDLSTTKGLRKMPKTLTEEQSVKLAKLMILMNVPREERLDIITAIETVEELQLFLDKLSAKNFVMTPEEVNEALQETIIETT